MNPKPAQSKKTPKPIPVHCPVVAEVMTELMIDNCPGVRWVEVSE